MCQYEEFYYKIEQFALRRRKINFINLQKNWKSTSKRHSSYRKNRCVLVFDKRSNLSSWFLSYSSNGLSVMLPFNWWSVFPYSLLLLTRISWCHHSHQCYWSAIWWFCSYLLLLSLLNSQKIVQLIFLLRGNRSFLAHPTTLRLTSLGVLFLIFSTVYMNTCLRYLYMYIPQHEGIPHHYSGEVIMRIDYPFSEKITK